MLNSGIVRDNMHYNVSEDEGYNADTICILSPREPGKTTSIMLDVVYSKFKKYGWPAIVLVNQAADISEAYLSSFETTINQFKGYEIHTKYPSAASHGGVTMVREKETNKPFIYVISLNTPKTRLKRNNLGRVSCIWYDECNVDVTIGEKWPDDIANKWNELYTTHARNAYLDKTHPGSLKFYMTGNFYTRYNPLLIYLGVDVNKLEIGKKFLSVKNIKIVDDQGKEEDKSIRVLVDCYQLKPELRAYILKHNPGYHFDDTYERYFLGQAIGEIGILQIPNLPDGYKLKYAFKFGSRYLRVWRGDEGYWLEATAQGVGKRKDVYVTSIDALVRNSILAKEFRQFFGNLRFGIATGNVSYNSPEAYYYMQQLYAAI